MKRQLVKALPAIVMALCFWSCANESDEYSAPEYGEMVQEPNPAVPGQIVRLTFPQKSKGSGIKRADYTWRISLPTAIEDKKSAVYDLGGKEAPSYSFMVPSNIKNASFLVTMKVLFVINDHKDNDVDFYDEKTAYGTLHVQ